MNQVMKKIATPEASHKAKAIGIRDDASRLDNDSTGERQVLENAKSFSSKMILTDRLFVERDFAACQNLLDSLIYLCSEQSVAQTEVYVDYMEMMMDVYATDSTIEIDSNQKVQLETWAADSTIFVQSGAQALMSMVYDSVYDYHILGITGGTSSKRSNEDVKPKVDKVNFNERSPRFKLYPNPNNGKMTLEYELEEMDGTFYLYDITGKNQLELFLPKENNKIEINNLELVNGMYLFQIRNDDKKLFNGRIAILK